MARRSGLGKGLDALIPTDVADAGEATLQDVRIADVRPNPNQPRREFDEESLSELAASIDELVMAVGVPRQPMEFESIDRKPVRMIVLLGSPANRVQGFLAAGHVCTITGLEEYRPIAETYRVDDGFFATDPHPLPPRMPLEVRDADGNLEPITTPVSGMTNKEVLTIDVLPTTLGSLKALSDPGSDALKWPLEEKVQYVHDHVVRPDLREFTKEQLMSSLTLWDLDMLLVAAVNAGGPRRPREGKAEARPGQDEKSSP